MLLVLRHTDGRWCAPSQQNTGENFPDGFGERWADAVCETLGLAVGSLVPHVVADDADPRTGQLIEDPNVIVPEPEPEPQLSKFDQLLGALASDKGLDPATAQAIAALQS